MKSAEMAASGLRVSPLGIGLAALGRPGYINLGHGEDLAGDYDAEVMRARAHRVLDAAWEQGIRYFDAARSYGRAEDFLGSWLNSRKRASDAVTVASKWGYTYTAHWRVQADAHEVKEHSLAVLRRQWRESQGHLHGFLKIYQIHSATFESGVLANTEVLAELARLKDGGIRMGLSLSGPGQADILREAMRRKVDGMRLFDTVQATWNLLEPSAGTALAEAHQAGMGIIIKESLANGRLTPRNREPGFRGRLDLLEREATRLATSLDALCIAAALAQPWADVVLSGAADVGQLHSNVSALQVGWDEMAADRLHGLAELPARYWQRRSELAWN